MKKFLTKTILFFTPILLFLIFPFYILSVTKEVNFNLDEIDFVKQKYLIGYKYEENNYKYLKLKETSKRGAEVLVLGSSRVLQFRDEMFQESFYNAGFTIRGIDEFQKFLKLIPPKDLPKYLIIGLDQWMFNESWDNLEMNSFQKKQFIENGSGSFTPKLNKLSMVYRDILAKKITISSLSKNRKNYTPVGINAWVNETGFRNDGSMYYGKQIKNLIKNSPNSEDYNYADTFDRISEGSRRFQYGSKINNKAVEILNELLDYCHKNKINVIGILPPFADGVYNKMKESNNYNYIDKLFPEIEPIFDKYSFELYNFNSMKDCNSNDNETIDGFHGGEKTYLKILIKILENHSILNNVCDLKRIKQNLNNSINNYIVYSY
tara:strand:- start:607521 stop:608654 length:1134 start_codon:yes stop_codon:yes gene_type:complete